MNKRKRRLYEDYTPKVVRKKTLYIQISKKNKILDEKCSICLEKIYNMKNTNFLPCCHFFHDDCIDRWLDKNITCPECRIPIFIKDHEQLEEFYKYLTQQKDNQDLIRRNIPRNDNNISLMYMRDPSLFSIEEVDVIDTIKLLTIMNRPDPSFDEMYEHLFDEDDVAMSSSIHSQTNQPLHYYDSD